MNEAEAKLKKTYTMTEFWKSVLTDTAIFIVVMAIISCLFYEDYHPAPQPCKPSAHRMYFPVATPFDAEPHLTDKDLQNWYETYRRMYFRSDLPDARVFWADLPSLMGRTNRTETGQFEIRIDRKSNPDAKEALFTLLHEMCHVDMWNKEFDEHGKLWQYDMHRLSDEDAFEDLW